MTLSFAFFLQKPASNVCRHRLVLCTALALTAQSHAQSLVTLTDSLSVTDSVT